MIIAVNCGKTRRDVPSSSLGYQTTVEWMTFQYLFLATLTPLLPPHVVAVMSAAQSVVLQACSVNRLYDVDIPSKLSLSRTLNFSVCRPCDHVRHVLSYCISYMRRILVAGGEGEPDVDQLRQEVALLRTDVDHIRSMMQDMHREVSRLGQTLISSCVYASHSSSTLLTSSVYRSKSHIFTSYTRLTALL